MIEDLTLGQWKIASSTVQAVPEESSKHEPMIPGLLRRVAPQEMQLEVIGFLDGDGQGNLQDTTSTSDERLPHIWGTDRTGNLVSLLDCRWKAKQQKSPHLAGGYEDWWIGWAASGEDWVTPSAECVRASIYIDDLRTFALYRHQDGVSFSESRDKVEVSLDDEILLSAAVGCIDIELVRSPALNYGISSVPREQVLTVDNKVYWAVSGTLDLESIRQKWVNGLERFARLVTMRASIVTDVHCVLDREDPRRRSLSLWLPRLPRPDRAPLTRQERRNPSEFLATLHSLVQYGCDPATLLCRYFELFESGAADLAMWFHLESQDRLLGASVNEAYLNSVRSIESLFAHVHSGENNVDVHLRRKLKWAVSEASEIGTTIVDAWPLDDAFSDWISLRNEVAHGNPTLSTGLNVKCLASATALQWIQRSVFLLRLGVSEEAVAALIRDGASFRQDLESLGHWRGLAN
ncbi:MAG: hypothetical protein OXH86_11255 [Acidimicrobiaceae bacterium]|nr:hypothetical protein [Acidimicrobiaceae bacterium]